MALRRSAAAPVPGRPSAPAPVHEPVRPVRTGTREGPVQRLLGASPPSRDDVLSLQRAIGNRAVQRMLALRGTPRGIQRAPLDYRNTATARSFKVSNLMEVAGRIDAMEDRRFGTKHSGYLTYEVYGKDMLVKHVESHPEAGSGIGSLLIYLAALKAGQLGCKTMTLAMPANSAQGFYKSMGFDFSGEVEKKRQAYIAQGRLADFPAVPSIASVTADLVEVHAASATSAAKRWKRLDEGQETSI